MHSIAFWPTLIALTIAAATDIRSRRIPNWLVVPFLAGWLLAPAVAKFVIEAPLVARKHRAGNFVIIRINDTGERIPLTVVESDSAGGTITLMPSDRGAVLKLRSPRVYSA